MTDKELTIWEHSDSVIRVLTSKEMGAWLYRRDKKILVTELEKIKAEIVESSFETYEKYSEEPIVCNYTVNVMQIIDKHIAELKGE